jgi:hypothetical protein
MATKKRRDHFAEVWADAIDKAFPMQSETPQINKAKKKDLIKEAEKAILKIKVIIEGGNVQDVIFDGPKYPVKVIIDDRDNKKVGDMREAVYKNEKE